MIGLLDEQLDAADRLRLVELLRNDPAARTYYLRYMLTDAMLRLEHSTPIEVGRRGGGSGRRDFGIRNLDNPQISRSLIPHSAICPSHHFGFVPTLHSSLFTLQSSVGSFLFSNLMAAVILGIGLLIGWTWRSSHYDQRSRRKTLRGKRPLPPEAQRGDAAGRPRSPALADCRWTDPATEAFERDPVPLGRKYALASGFMEITYDSGAKVILQGPCTYEVESARGGFLSVGKLTARVEKKGSGFRVQDSGSKGERTANLALSKRANNQPLRSPLAPRSGGERRGERGEGRASNPQSLIPNPLFVIRTPTAVVTDLGTEFGVEVDRSGASRSHVFQGKVEIAAG